MCKFKYVSFDMVYVLENPCLFVYFSSATFLLVASSCAFGLHTKRKTFDAVNLPKPLAQERKKAKLAHRVDLGTLSQISFPRQGYHSVVSSNSFNCKQAYQPIFQTTGNSLLTFAGRSQKPSSEHGLNLTVVTIRSIAYSH